MRNIPKAGTPSEAESGVQAATQRRRRLEQDLVNAKDRIRGLRAKLNYKGTTKTEKKHLRPEAERAQARIARLEAELGR